MQEDGETMLAKGLFGLIPEDRLFEHGFAGSLVREAVLRDKVEFVATNAEALTSVATRVRVEEERFVASVRKLAGSIDAGALEASVDALRSDEGLKLVAKTRVSTLALNRGVTPDPDGVEAAAIKVLSAFPVAIHFLRDFLTDFLTSDMNMEAPRNRNSTWDLKIAFHASSGAAVLGVPTLLVSEDPRLLRAASSAHQVYRVVQLADYRALLASPVALAARADMLRGTA
jgi:hypothetical protein